VNITPIFVEPKAIQLRYKTTTMNIITYYKIQFPTMSDPQYFSSESEARDAIETQYKNRSKNDGHDEYWRNTNPVVVKFTKEILG